MASAVQREKIKLSSLLKEQMYLEAVRDLLQKKVAALRDTADTNAAEKARNRLAKITKKSS